MIGRHATTGIQFTVADFLILKASKRYLNEFFNSFLFEVCIS